MFTMTEEWLHAYYGSHGEDQIMQAKDWLHQYGKNVSLVSIDEWANWKHLIEYQVNTNDIVDQCLGRIGTEFETEIEAHAWVNCLRVPAAYSAYQTVLDTIGPVRSIIELGVGGDSAISTACFLNHLSKWPFDPTQPPVMMSVDRNPLGMTAKRYKGIYYWNFFLADSVSFLQECVRERVRVDLVFIDTIHSYGHTLKELDLAYMLSDDLLMDDATFEGNDFDEKPGGVKRALEEWMRDGANWKRTDYADGTVCLLQKVV